MVTVHAGAAAWFTVTDAPRVVNVADRAAPVLRATARTIVALPRPEAGEGAIHDALLVRLHSHDASISSDTECVLPAAAALTLEGANAPVHIDPPPPPPPPGRAGLS